jgi:hypothetical protein
MRRHPSADLNNYVIVSAAVYGFVISHPRPLTLGSAFHIARVTTADYGTEVEVNAGVKDGGKLILRPPVNLGNGDKVQIAPEPPAATP